MPLYYDMLGIPEKAKVEEIHSAFWDCQANYTPRQRQLEEYTDMVVAYNVLEEQGFTKSI